MDAANSGFTGWESRSPFHIETSVACVGDHRCSVPQSGCCSGYSRRPRSRLAFSAAGGAVAGLILGILAHPAMWYLTIVFAKLTGVRSSLDEAPVDLLNGLWASWVYSAFSLLIVGWASVPLSAIVGELFAHIAGSVTLRRS